MLQIFVINNEYSLQYRKNRNKYAEQTQNKNYEIGEEANGRSKTRDYVRLENCFSFLLEAVCMFSHYDCDLHN